MALIIAAIVVTICLILLGLISDLLVDWLWFSAIGYLYVFWTTIGAQAGVFFAVFVATAIILWLNGSLASRFALPPASAAGHANARALRAPIGQAGPRPCRARVQSPPRQFPARWRR